MYKRQYLNYAAQAALQFGSGDWTFECFAYPSAIQAQRLLDARPSPGNGPYPTVGMNGSGNFDFTANAAVQITGTTVASVGTWYHVAVCRSGTSTRLFVNGVQEGSTYSDTTSYIAATNRPVIGGDGFSIGSNLWNGYIDDLRITKGVARYTSNFSVPTAEFPNS